VLIFAAGVAAGVLYYQKAVAEEKHLKEHVSAEIKNLRLQIHNTFDEFARSLGKKL
jgi:hypothetical protein